MSTIDWWKISRSESELIISHALSCTRQTTFWASRRGRDRVLSDTMNKIRTRQKIYPKLRMNHRLWTRCIRKFESFDLLSTIIKNRIEGSDRSTSRAISREIRAITYQSEESRIDPQQNICKICKIPLPFSRHFSGINHTGSFSANRLKTAYPSKKNLKNRPWLAYWIWLDDEWTKTIDFHI